MGLEKSAANLDALPHRRLNLLTGKWVLVSSHRSTRPWQGQEENDQEFELASYDKDCYLCPGNTRVSGIKNTDYSGTYSFENDHAALVKLDKSFCSTEDDLLKARSESGCCKVVCFSARHDITLAEMDVEDIVCVIELWKREYTEIGARTDINYVQIFENKGSAMGCSSPHPHGQIWAQESIPDEPATEIEHMNAYEGIDDESVLLIDYLDREINDRVRVVCENDDFAVVVPFWATWPFEALVLPKQNLSHICQMTSAQTKAYAEIIKEITVRYDNLFETSFPYSAGIHQAPVDGGDYSRCTFHMHFYPPLLRSATVKKFMVGYEMLGGAQRDITPEVAAELLRECSNIHYKNDKTNS